MSVYAAAAVEARYRAAREVFAEAGVDVEAALRQLDTVAVSLQCWQGDDVGGFENPDGGLGGGIAVTGNYPGKARNAAQLRQDLEQTYSLLPGHHRLALHAIYGEFGGKKVDRTEVGTEHFAGWIAWAKQQGVGLDFNQTFFSHPKAASGFTLSHHDAAIRNFWIGHAERVREIAAAMGQAQGNPCVCNLWIPDGFKDTPADRLSPRRRLKESLDTVFAKKHNKKHLLDAVESKLFGIGAESCTIGSHEFYLPYAERNQLLYCLDMGHYHPTESVADKISSALLFLPELLLHVSRGVRWDSDHVVILNDDVQALALEVVRCNALDRVHLGLDFFDASINRIAAWTIGARSLLKAMLIALLEPAAQLRAAENAGDYTARLLLMEEAKQLPYGDVWNYHCQRHNVPLAGAWLEEVRRYERSVLSLRK